MYKLLILIFILTSCSSLYKKDKNYPYNYENKFTSEDYLIHLSKISKLYNNETKKLKLNRRARNYVNKISRQLYLNNPGLFLKDDKGINFYVIDDNRNFYFSMPGNDIYFSKGLLANYMNNENVFVSVIIGELLRSKIGIYKKHKVIPINSYDVSDMIKINLLDINAKRDLNNLIFDVLKRTGYDPEARLLWLQILNRNSMSFNVQGVTSRELSKEEFLLKNYMVKSKKDKNVIFEKNSSRSFYYFKESIVR